MEHTALAIAGAEENVSRTGRCAQASGSCGVVFMWHAAGMEMRIKGQVVRGVLKRSRRVDASCQSVCVLLNERVNIHPVANLAKRTFSRNLWPDLGPDDRGNGLARS